MRSQSLIPSSVSREWEREKSFRKLSHHFDSSVKALNKLEMSNESSASETTPLRRPESQLSAAESSSTNVANNSNNNNDSSNNITAAQTELTFPSPSVYNNFRIEERLNANNNNHCEPQQQQRQQQSHKNNMDTNKRILCRVGLDILILLCGE